MKADSNDTEIIHHDDYYKGPALVRLPCGSITLLDLAINRYRNSPNSNVYGTIRNGEVVWTTNQQFLLQVIQIFLFIKNYLKRGMVAGICSENRYEWVASHQSIHMAGCMDCAIYPTATKDAILHILNQTEMEVCFLSGERASFLAKYILPEVKDTKLKHVIVFDDFDEKEVYKKMGIQVHLWSDLNQLKNSSKELIDQVLKEHEETMMTGKKDRYTPCTICYTSGTTGLPKGVVLSNINFIEILGGFLRTEDEFFVKINQDDVYLSYLTLSHVLERVAQMVVSFNGGSVVFYSGDMYKLGSDLSLVRPTLLAAVPAVLSKMRDKIMEKIRSKRQFTQTLFAKCLSRKIKAQKYGQYSSFLYDFFVFKKIAKSLGGRLRAVLVGGALTDPKLIEFFQAILSCKVFVGYGSTEMTGLGCLTPVECYDTNIVGTPFPTVQFKAVNEHGDPERKEIYVRGRSVFSEYYKNEEETKKSIIDGWYKTGDLGFFRGGKLKIVGRNKDHFKNSKGEFVSPEKIEIALRQSPIDDILVVGNSNVGYVAAIVVCSEEFTETEILDEINQICKEQLEQQTMKPFEVPKKVLLRREPFDKLGDIRTATNKLKRHEIERILKDEIDQLLKDE